ncbi:uncharacterized protein si:ch211-248a14.8 [Megalops cyprinoides]|uniref:uncharacterized protein si:ch211-248a14.8 n=1 Tax=Megalops cyprinoides TaxID=118141 RepID=UPI00186562F3|nr:uncharacterized protein si:ch211-248a14.8 [Megalops cyprinoides]
MTGCGSGTPAWFNRKWSQRLSTLSALPLDLWQSLPAWIRIGAALLALLIYSQSNRLYSFVTHIFISQYRFPYVVPLSFAQVVVTLLALQTLHAVGCITLLPYSLQLGEWLLVPSICDSIQTVLALWADISAPSGLYPLTLHLLPLACVGWTHALGLTPPPSSHTTFLLAAVTLTSVTITGTRDFLLADPLVCLYAPLSLLLHSLSLCWLACVGNREAGQKGQRVSPFDLYFSLTVNKSLVLGFLCLLHPDAPRMLGEGCWHSLLFLGYLLAMLLLGSLQRLLLALTALYCTPLAASLLDTGHGLFRSFTSLL